MKRIILSLCIMGLAVASCKKKDDDKNNCEATQASVAGSYKLTSFKLNGTEAIDLAFEPCEKDDIVVLNANGTYIYQDAGTVCDPAGGDNGLWHITDNKFFIDFYSAEDFTIQSFDCKNLVGTATDGGTTVTATFTKQ
jgi:Lipocalin-like domain